MKLFKFTKISKMKHLIIILMYGINYSFKFDANFRFEVEHKPGVGVSVTDAIKIRFNTLMWYADHYCKWNNMDLQEIVYMLKNSPNRLLKKYKVSEKDYAYEVTLMRSYTILNHIAETINQNYTLDEAMVKECLSNGEISYIAKQTDRRWHHSCNKNRMWKFTTNGGMPITTNF